MRILIKVRDGEVLEYDIATGDPYELDISIYDTYTTELMGGKFDFEADSDIITDKELDRRLEKIHEQRNPSIFKADEEESE